MSAKNDGSMVMVTGPSDIVLVRPDVSKIEDPFDKALDRVGKRHHQKIFDAAWKKWWKAYYDMIFEAAWNAACESDTSSQEEFDKTLDACMEREVSLENDRTFDRFFDYEFRKRITHEMVAAEMREIEAGR